MERQVSDIKTEDDQYPIDCYAYLSKCNPVKWTCTKPEENDIDNWTEYLYRVYNSEDEFIDCTSSYSDLIDRVCSVYTDGMVVCTDYKTLYYDSNSDSPYVVNNLVVCNYAYLSKCNPVKWYKDVPSNVEYISYPTSMSFSESCTINGTSEYVSLVSQICDSLTSGMKVSNPYKYLSYDEGNRTYVVKNCCVYEFDTSDCNFYTGRCLQGDEFSGYKYDASTCLYSNGSSACKYTYVVPSSNDPNSYLQYNISSKKFVSADISIYCYDPFNSYKYLCSCKLTKDSVNYTTCSPGTIEDGKSCYFNTESKEWQDNPINTSSYQAVYVAGTAVGLAINSTFTGSLLCIVCCPKDKWTRDAYDSTKGIACTSKALPSDSVSIGEFCCYKLSGSVGSNGAFNNATWSIVKDENST